MFFYSKPLVQCCAVAMGSTPGGAVFVTAAGRGQSVTFLATSASIFTAADTESALWAPATATQATKETTVKKVRATNQTPVVLSSKLIGLFQYLCFSQKWIVISYVSQETMILQQTLHSVV